MTDQMPKDINAEKAVLSIILGNSEKFSEIADCLSPSDFYKDTFQEIWKAMASLYKQGQEIDVVSIKMELVKLNVDPKPAMEDLIICYNEIGISDTNLVNFSNVVKNKSMLRQIICMANKSMLNSKEEGADATSQLANLEKEIVDVMDVFKDKRPSDVEGILEEINTDIVKGQETGWKGFDTGFSVLDEVTGGLIPTQSWVVGAYTGQGKTFFLLQMLLNVLERGAKVMLISTEMDRKTNMLRLLGNLAGLGTIQILKGKMDEGEKESFLEAQKKMEGFKSNLTIYDNVYTVEEIRLKAKKKKLREGLDVLFVDFIQNLRGNGEIYERMSRAAVELQHLAQELGIAIVIASQVSQSSAGWQSKEVMEYKGAGEIAAIADVALWINKVKEDKSQRQVVLRKVRHGIPGKFNVRLSFPSGRVISISKTLMDEAENVGEDSNV